MLKQPLEWLWPHTEWSVKQAILSEAKDRSQAQTEEQEERKEEKKEREKEEKEVEAEPKESATERRDDL